MFPGWDCFVPNVGMIRVLPEFVEFCNLLRLKELDDLLMKPENASNMEFVTEYTTTKKALDEEVERWEKLSEELEQLTN